MRQTTPITRESTPVLTPTVMQLNASLTDLTAYPMKPLHRLASGSMSLPLDKRIPSLVFAFFLRISISVRVALHAIIQE